MAPTMYIVIYQARYAVILSEIVPPIICIYFVHWGQNSLIFEDISMKLGGQMGHGPNSSYHDV